MLLITRVKVKYYISSTVPLMKIPKEPKRKLYLCRWPVNHLFCCRRSSHFHRERQKNSCKKRRTGQYAACHSHLMSPKREKNKQQQQQQQYIVKAQRLGAGRWLFRKPSSNFYIVSQREVSDRLPVISAVPGEEKYRGGRLGRSSDTIHNTIASKTVRKKKFTGPILQLGVLLRKRQMGNQLTFSKQYSPDRGILLRRAEDVIAIRDQALNWFLFIWLFPFVHAYNYPS